MGAEKVVRYWQVRRRDMSRMKSRRRHREAQIALLPMLEGNQKPNPRGIKEVGAKSKDIKERLEVAERNYDAPFE